MAKNFNTLKKKISPGRRKKIYQIKHEMLEEMMVAELRKFMGLTQTQAAENFGTSQPHWSQLESANDMQINTLAQIIKALGGQLELIAHMPNADIRVSQNA
jgi:DNA-directed RNA polymerase specialized sigma subunit